jgi:hypothetical protein
MSVAITTTSPAHKKGHDHIHQSVALSIGSISSSTVALGKQKNQFANNITSQLMEESYNPRNDVVNVH